MKKYSLFFALFIVAPLYAATFDSLPVTGADVAKVLELNPADYQISKTSVSFDTPVEAILRCTSLGHSRDFTIPGTSSSFTLLTYIPKDGGSIKPLRFWLSGSKGAVHSSFAVDTDKVGFSRTEILDGVFTVQGASSDDFSDPQYTIQLLISTEDAEQGAAANP